jgi:phosphatidylserine decarboxylase
MVRDGIYYGLGLVAVAGVVAWFTDSVWFAIPPLLLAMFFMWFFRDPERRIPDAPGQIVSPADGKVTDISTVEVNGEPRTRISIFLNVFDVHVNRSPIAGVIKQVEYRAGRFANAMGATSADINEQNIVTVEGESQSVVFKQIAGLIARRIVFKHKPGDVLARGQRVGLIKFGSRTDVIFDPRCAVKVRLGERVRGGATVLAQAPVAATGER